MAKKNDFYWKERMAALEDEQYSKSTAYYRDLEKQFREASNSIQMEIERWYNRLADNNGVSYAKAKKLLKANELEEFNWTVQQYIKAGKENAVDQRWLKELENASARYHISYLEVMKLQIRQHAELLFTAYEGGMTEFLQETYSDNYYHTAFEIAKGKGAGSNLARLDPKKIDTIIRKPWAQDGSGFSERIWDNKEKLVNKLHTELSQSMIRGSDPKKAIRNLAQVMDVNQSQAGRLIMTESAAIASTAQKDCFIELGVEQYEILATLDTRTSEICRDMDGKVFAIKNYEVGVTAPPFHPNCRTTTVPYFDDEFSAMEMRAARDPVTEKSTEVPASMTYKQWHEEFVENNPEAALVETMQKNKATDRKQYEEYKKILGKEGSKSLDSFQKLKYTNVKEWNAKRREYATISKVNQKQWSDDFKKKAIGAYYQFKKAGIEISDHGLARFLDRSKGKIPYTFEDIMKQFKMPVNYVQNDGNEIRFYNERAVISSPDTHEIITIVNRKTISKEWKRSHE
ncbi:MAG: minor capsid protein [Hungatella sp.]|jgi:SPP1 gp7 family putative phage head morphogenesis protein|nr:minor capsid protein [Hungatella sp.]